MKQTHFFPPFFVIVSLLKTSCTKMFLKNIPNAP